MPPYSPSRGDYITVTLNPQTGHKQKDRRSALVVSHDLFNLKTGLVIVCPITKTLRPHPFHVPIENDPDITGMIMIEQVMSIDFRARNARQISHATQAVLDEVLSLLDACIF